MNTADILKTFITPALLGLLCANLAAAENLAADATVTASSQLNADYPPENVIDGVILDASRWLSADSPEDKWLILEMPETRVIAGYALYSGWQSSDAVTQVFVEQRQGDQWVIIPSSVVTGNDSQELIVRFDEDASTDALRFVFEEDGGQDGIVRVREIVVWAPGDEPEIGDPMETPIDPDKPVILANQSGYNLGGPKRFTAVGFEDGAEFAIVTSDGTEVFQGTLEERIGDFSGFNPAGEEEYLVKIGETTSDPFRIGPWWLERVTYQNAMDFMIDSRNYVGNTGRAAGIGYSWRDDTHFAFSLRSLVSQYLSNPAAYTRMPGRIGYVKPSDSSVGQSAEGKDRWGVLTPYDSAAPDIIKMIHWGADVIVSQQLTHEHFKGELAFFLYAWPWMEQWLDPQNFEVVKGFALEHWETSTIDQNYPYDASDADGHNLFEIKTKIGGAKGGYPPGASILPNTLMALVLERENDDRAPRFRQAARDQVSWITANIDVEDPDLTKGQRMSADLLMTSLAKFARLDPEGVPADFQDFIQAWSDVVIRRSDNLWDFFRLTDDGKWVVYEDGSKLRWNDPGSVLAMPSALLEAASLLDSPEKAQRLRQIAYSSLDHAFGRNPSGRHFSYDAPREIEGVERGWYHFHGGGIGALRDVPFVFDGAPKDPLYPYQPEIGDIGWTEGWVNFNTAFNRSLAVLAYHESDLKLTPHGDRLEVVLTAPLNFDYTQPDPVTVTLTTENGDKEDLELTEPEPYSRVLRGSLPLVGSQASTRENGILEVSSGGSIHGSYGFGYFEREQSITIDGYGTTVTQ